MINKKKRDNLIQKRKKGVLPELGDSTASLLSPAIMPPQVLLLVLLGSPFLLILLASVPAAHSEREVAKGISQLHKREPLYTT